MASTGVGASLRDSDVRRQRRELEARFEQVGLAQLTLDMSGTITAVNEAMCALVGVARADLVGSDTARLHHPSDADYGLLHVGPLLGAERTSDSWERVFAGADGSPVPVLVHATVIRDRSGAPESVACFLHDLTRLREAERTLAGRTARFEALMQSAECALVVGDDGCISYASPAVRWTFGYDQQSLIGLPTAGFGHPEDVARMHAAVARVKAAPGRRDTALVRLRAADGHWVWADCVLTNRSDEPDIGGVVYNIRDVSERVAAEQALQASETRFRAIAETAQEGIVAADPDGAILFANAKLADILGLDLEAVYATLVPQLLCPDDPASMAARLHDRARRGAERYEITYPHPDGEPRILALSVCPLLGLASNSQVAMISDVTRERAAEAELRRRALYDELTGLANRTLLMDRLEQAVARVERGQDTSVAVLFADLDQFKLVNDSWGHAAGDELLRQVAERLRAAVRPGDTVGRFGGDEFVVVCEDTEQDRASGLAEDIIARLGEPFLVDGQPAHVGVSVGIALSPPQSAVELMRFADAAMYEAKSRGRRRAHLFDRSLTDAATDRLVLGGELLDALAAGSLELYYQPVVCLATGAVLGVEGLARWRHPQRGWVAPDRFVPLAVVTGQAAALDRWALGQACADAPLLSEIFGHRLQIAVNICTANLTEEATHRNLLATLAGLAVPPDQLVLEITEGALVQQPERAREVLELLRAAGVRAAIDDFGTGYSSLAYLTRLPAQTLKIDRSFVQHLGDDASSFAIVAAIVDLARTLDLRTVAEGVETVEQLGMLRRLGCTAGQGFLWSQALPLDELAALGERLPGGRFRVAGDAALPAPRRPPCPVTVDHGLRQLLQMHREGASFATIAAALNSAGFRTPQRRRWHAASVERAIAALRGGVAAG